MSLLSASTARSTTVTPHVQHCLPATQATHTETFRIYALLYHMVLCCAVLCCAVLCCAVLCCV